MMKAWFITIIVCFLIQLNSGMCGFGDKEQGNEESVFSSGSVFQKHESVTLPQNSEDSAETARSWSPFSFISPRGQARMVSVSTLFCSIIILSGLFLGGQASEVKTAVLLCNPFIHNSCENCTLDPNWQELFDQYKTGAPYGDMQLRHGYCVLQRFG